MAVDGVHDFFFFGCGGPTTKRTLLLLSDEHRSSDDLSALIPLDGTKHHSELGS